MPSATATIGAANAGGAPTDAPISLPVGGGGERERAAFESLLGRARTAGVRGARLFGHTTRAAGPVGEAAHALAGVTALATAATGLDIGLLALIGVVLSAALRALGIPALEQLLPRRAGWSLVLRPFLPTTRVVVASLADREPPVPWLPRMTLGALLIGLLATPAGAWAVVAAAGLLLAVAGVAAWLARPPRPDPAGPESVAAEALDALAARLGAVGEGATAVLVAGGASAAAGGVVAALDWWGVRPADTEVRLVGAPDTVRAAAEALGRAGWRVLVVPPPDLRSQV